MFNKKIEKVISIEGMRCNGCATRVANTLNALKEVKDVKVSLEDKCALVTLKKELSDEAITEAITNLGFIVTEIK